jgi:SAM-dependent methyltransferase
MTSPAAATPYALPNSSPDAADLHEALAALYDPMTTERLIELSDGTMWADATCLEVGAGAGSIAHRLAEAVGDSGHVYATDLIVDHIAPHPRLTIAEHDLRTDPLPGGLCDLIHGRRVLEHLPQREAILDRLVAKLAHGGTILIEDGRSLRTPEIVISAPNREAADLYVRYQQAVGRAFERQGLDSTWAPGIHHAFLARGLAEVETHIHARYWTGGDAGCRLLIAAQKLLRERLLSDGMTERELDQVLDLLTDKRLVVRSHEIYATSGRRLD